MAKRFHCVRCSMRKMSATISRAERKAVSPDVIGAATTPNSARIPPAMPSVVFEMMLTAHAALLPFAASASASACAPPKKAVATAAHMRAMMLSEIIAPKKTERHSRSLRTQRAISGDCVA